MARIRSVHPDICTDEGLVDVSAEAERLFVRLWTHLDDDGRCLYNPLLLKAALFPIHRGVEEWHIEGWVEELVVNGQLHRYTVDGKHYLTAKPDRWTTWQKPRRKVDSKHPGPECADNVRTPSDSGAQCPPGGVGGDVDGGKAESEKEGESEGEAERGSAYLRPVDNPNPVTLGLVAQLDAIAQTAALKSQPATGTEPLTSSSALTNGVAK